MKEKRKREEGRRETVRDLSLAAVFGFLGASIIMTTFLKKERMRHCNRNSNSRGQFPTTSKEGNIYRLPF